MMIPQLIIIMKINPKPKKPKKPKERRGNSKCAFKNTHEKTDQNNLSHMSNSCSWSCSQSRI